jgi:RecB family exonuclease
VLSSLLRPVPKCSSEGPDSLDGVEGAQLGFDLGLERLVRVTPARLAAWDDCPRRYRLTYLDRPPAGRGGARAASTLGAVVHLALRALFERPPDARTPAAAAGLVERYWSGEGFRDDRQAAAYRAAAAEWVAGYVAHLLERPNHDTGSTDDTDTERVVALERWVSASVGRVVAEGRVDRIDRRGDELVVVDYKTGRRVPDDADAAASPALALYALATARTLRRECWEVELHHLPSGRVASFRHDEGTLAEHLRRAEQSADELAAASDALPAGDPDALFPALPAARCGSCPVRRSCPDGQAVGPVAPAWDGLVGIGVDR